MYGINLLYVLGKFPEGSVYRVAGMQNNNITIGQ